MSVLTRNGRILTTPNGPLQLPNLKLYLSASRMYQYADGTSIPSMIDYSGNNYHANQIGTYQPTFETGEFGVNSGIKFNDHDDVLSLISGLNMLNSVTQFTFQTLVKRVVTDTPAFIFGVRDAANSNYRLKVEFTSTNISVAIKKDDADSISTLTIPSNDLNTHFIQITLNPTDLDLYIYIDGTLRGTITLTTATMDADSASAIYVGGAYFSFLLLNGISVNTTYLNVHQIAAQYKGYLDRGYL